MPNRGRPTVYTDALADEICTRLSAGESLLHICLDDHMPDESTVRDWAIHNRGPGFSPKYAEAREKWADHQYEMILQIADNTQPGVKTIESDKGTQVITADMTEHRKLQVDARKWMLARMAKYRDKMDHAHTDPAGNKFILEVVHIKGDTD